MKKMQLKISGMHCTSCAMSIEGELEDAEGVEEASINYARQKGEVTFDPEKITPQELMSIIHEVDSNYKADIENA